MRFFIFALTFCFFIAFLTLNAVAQTKQQTNSPGRIQPKNDLYIALERRLLQLNTQLSDGNQNGSEQKNNAVQILDFGSNILKPGAEHPDVLPLRDRLLGLNGITVKKGNNQSGHDVSMSGHYLYDDALVSAVKVFQAKHGLKSDGLIGKDTLALLNMTPEQERKQVEVNLKRLEGPEWSGRPDTRIEVDIARYWLTAYEDNKIAFEMPVIVGTKERQTNRFSTVMTGVRLNPGWTIPSTIKAKDYIPKLRSNPDWLNQQGVMIFSSYDKDAEPVDPNTIDWSVLSDSDIQAMRFYKYAGDKNPLGRFRFLMDNQYDIYLHDTNLKFLFDRSDRAFSSGCVRVSDPARIADFLLKGDPGWTKEKLDSILEKGETVNIRAKRSVPVYFDYKTAWLDASGQLVLGYDIYGLD